MLTIGTRVRTLIDLTSVDWLAAAMNPDDIVAAVPTELGLRVDQIYALADAIVAEISKTARLIDRGRIFRVIETEWLDGNDELQTFTVYTETTKDPR